MLRQQNKSQPNQKKNDIQPRNAPQRIVAAEKPGDGKVHQYQPDDTDADELGTSLLHGKKKPGMRIPRFRVSKDIDSSKNINNCSL